MSSKLLSPIADGFCRVWCFICNVERTVYPFLQATVVYLFPSQDISSQFVKEEYFGGIVYYSDTRTGKQLIRSEAGRFRVVDDPFLAIPIIVPVAVWAVLCYCNVEYVRRLTLLEMPFAPPPPPPPHNPFPPPFFPSPFPPPPSQFQGPFG